MGPCRGRRVVPAPQRRRTCTGAGCWPQQPRPRAAGRNRARPLRRAPALPARAPGLFCRRRACRQGRHGPAGKTHRLLLPAAAGVCTGARRHAPLVDWCAPGCMSGPCSPAPLGGEQLPAEARAGGQAGAVARGAAPGPRGRPQPGFWGAAAASRLRRSERTHAAVLTSRQCQRTPSSPASLLHPAAPPSARHTPGGTSSTSHRRKEAEGMGCSRRLSRIYDLDCPRLPVPVAGPVRDGAGRLAAGRPRPARRPIGCRPPPRFWPPRGRPPAPPPRGGGSPGTSPGRSAP